MEIVSENSTAPAARTHKFHKYSSHGTSMLYFFQKNTFIFLNSRFYEYKNALKSGPWYRLSTATVPPQRFERMERKGCRLVKAQLCATSRKLVNCYKMVGAATQMILHFVTSLTSHKIVYVLRQSSVSHCLRA